MLIIEAGGSPYQIGHRHGTQARYAIIRSIVFYEDLFRKTSGLTWTQVRSAASEFAENIQKQWPAFWSELKGIADGSGKDVLDIVALNVRTEIAFGMLNDGCTSLYARTDSVTLLGQNWDWMQAQKENLVYLTIKQKRKPVIRIVTEAGIIGKIGLNSHGLGVCFNALRIPGVTKNQIPAHLALRHVLSNHSTARAAANDLRQRGLASACFLLLGDANEAVGVECTSKTVRLQEMEYVEAAPGWHKQCSMQRLVHSNHLLLDHGEDAPKDTASWLENSRFRAKRMAELSGSLVGLRESSEQQQDAFSKYFEDEENFPQSICRAQRPPETETESLFNIVMDLTKGRAIVRVGRPTAVEDIVVIEFDEKDSNSTRNESRL